MLQKAEKCVVSADLKVGLMAAAIALGILAGIAGFFRFSLRFVFPANLLLPPL